MSVNRQFCRLCLSTPSVYFSLLEKDIPMMLEKLTAIKVNEMDEVTTISCIKCFLNLKLAYNIQRNIVRADERIRNKDFPVLTSLKEEINTFEEVWVNTDEGPAEISPESESDPEPTVESEEEDSFSDKVALENLRKLPNIYGRFECGLCHKKFKSKNNFEAHSHDKRQCPVCKIWIPRSYYPAHVYNHSTGPQICEFCGASLKNIQSLRAHKRNLHSDTSYCCEHCGKILKKRSNYKAHVKRHTGEKDYVCETCGKAFYSRIRMQKHIQGLHMKLRPYPCKFCKKAFSSRFAMRTHERQHTNETPYKCYVCGEGFRQNVSLKAHKRSKHNIHEDLTTPCPLCSREFASEGALTTHMRVHK